jgi:acyl-CoA-binding protein
MLTDNNLQFEEAVAVVKMHADIRNDRLHQLEAHYKQAIDGPATGELVLNCSHSELSKEEAKAEYCKMVDELVPG